MIVKIWLGSAFACVATHLPLIFGDEDVFYRMGMGLSEYHQAMDNFQRNGIVFLGLFTLIYLIFIPFKKRKQNDGERTEE